jgi:hypothetical protein
MKVILCIAIGLVLLSGGALLWSATRSAPKQPTTADIQRAKSGGLVRNYYRDDIESAKKQGKKEVLLPGAIDMRAPERSLEELLRDYGLLRVKVIGTETTVYSAVPEIPSADIETWYKVEILETLHRQGKVSDEAPPFELPSRLLPVLPSESLLVESGGVINVDGVAVVREVSTEGDVFIPREEYLIVGYLDYGGKLIRPVSGRAGVFHVINTHLMPHGQKERRLVHEIEEGYGNDLDRLRSNVH